MKRVIVMFALLGGASVLACVDLFHATDFQTLCDRDAEACDAAAPVVDASVPEAGDVTPDLCDTTPGDLAESVCARLGACLGPVGFTRFGECSFRARLAYDCQANTALRPRSAVARQWDCLARAKTCEEISACVFPSGVQTCRPTGAGTYIACGLGANTSTRVQCGSSTTPVAVEPCSLGGQTCATVDPESKRGECSGVLQAGCTGVPRCLNTSAVACEKVAGGPLQDVGLDCASYGAGVCKDYGTQGPTCVPGSEAPSCTSLEGRLECDGDRVRACVNGKLLALDCGRLGLTCVERARRGAWDIASWCSAAPDAGLLCDDPEDSCAGGKLLSCRRGQRVEVDCTALGLGACAASVVGAACAPPK